MVGIKEQIHKVYFIIKVYFWVVMGAFIWVCSPLFVKNKTKK